MFSTVKLKFVLEEVVFDACLIIHYVRVKRSDLSKECSKTFSDQVRPVDVSCIERLVQVHFAVLHARGCTNASFFSLAAL